MAQKPTKWPGVRYREHKSRKINPNGVQLDRYYYIRYTSNGKQHEEGLGWASQGWTAEDANDYLSKIKKANRTGEGPRSLKETREIAEQELNTKKAVEQEARQEAITFSEFFFERYLPNAKTSKTIKSWQREVSLFNIHINDVIGDLPLVQIKTSPHIEQIKFNMMEAGASPRSIQYTFAVIRQVFNYAKDTCKIISCDSPTKGIRWPKVDNLRERFLEHEEAEALLKAIKKRSTQTYEIALISLHTGMRAGEIFSMTWGQLRLNRREIFIPGNKTKGRRSRHVYIDDTLQEMLANKQPGEPDELVFKSQKGAQIEQISDAFDRAVNDLCLNNGHKDNHSRVVFHTLRHTFASWLVQNGLDLYSLQKLLGHASFAMVQRYAHLSPNAGKEAVLALATLHRG